MGNNVFAKLSIKILKIFNIKDASHNFKIQLILFFTVFSFSIIGIGSYYTYNNIIDMIKKQNEKYFMLLFRQSDYNIQNILNETENVIKLFILDDNVKQFLKTNSFEQTSDDTEVVKAVLEKIKDSIKSYSFINSIYFYTENHGEIGSNDKFSTIIRNDGENLGFFDSNIYKIAKAAYPKTVWEGGNSEKAYNPHTTGIEDSIFSAVKVVTSLIDSSKKTNLVFNIKQSHIANLYAGISDPESGNIYIINQSGRIISSRDGRNIGAVSPVISNIKKAEGEQKENGSFTVKNENSSIQTVYYKIMNTDWYLVGEIPLQLFSGDFSVLQRVFIFVFLASIIVIITVSFLWLGKITEPLNILAGKMHDMSSGKLGLTFSRIPNNELGIVIKRFNEMSLSMVELIRKNEEIQEEKRKVEIEALQYQINPHFIYNTLNMIKWMAMMTKSKNIVESVVSLGNLIRPAFKSMEKMCTLNEEKEYIFNYLKIMNLRFGNGISLEFHIEESLAECRVPRFILQPVVENSITHGMSKPQTSINICIEAYSENDELFIIVSDNGIGISEDKLIEINSYLAGLNNGNWDREDGSIGLYNVNRRIYLNFGNKSGVRLESREGEGTKALIRLPLNP